MGIARTKMSSAFFLGAGTAAACMGVRFVVQGSMMISKGGAAKGAAKAAEGAGSAAQGMGGAFTKMKSMMPGGGPDMNGFADPMTRREAFSVLGLKEGSNRNKVRDQHKKLMVLNHPDAGGSPFLASKVNEAKDYILSGRTDMK